MLIEHHLDVIKCADWILDLGPEGGQGGGELVFSGIPEDLIKCKASHTGKYLKSKLSSSKG
jgi:excinuclease ABC subunit A